MQLLTIHKQIAKADKREKKPAWIKQLKQWRPKKKGSQEFVLKSVAPKKNIRAARRASLAGLVNITRKLDHMEYQARQRKTRPTAHLMPKRPYLYPKYVHFPGQTLTSA